MITKRNDARSANDSEAHRLVIFAGCCSAHHNQPKIGQRTVTERAKL